MKRPTSSASFKIGMDAVRGARLRNFWTMFGIIVGVASVITVVAIGEGIKQQIGGQVHHLGQNLITIRPAQLSPGSNDPVNSVTGLTVSSTLSAKDIQTVGNTKGVGASAPLTITGGSASGDHGVYRDGFVIGTSGDLPGLLNQSLAYGSFFGPDDSGNSVVLGQHASEALFNEDVPLGRSLSFHGQTFIVTGIFNQFTTTPLSQQANFNNAIFIPNDMAESLTKQTAPTYEILVRPDHSLSAPALIGRLQARLNSAHGGASGLPPAVAAARGAPHSRRGSHTQGRRTTSLFSINGQPTASATPSRITTSSPLSRCTMSSGFEARSRPLREARSVAK